MILRIEMQLTFPNISFQLFYHRLFLIVSIESRNNISDNYMFFLSLESVRYTYNSVLNAELLNLLFEASSNEYQNHNTCYLARRVLDKIG
jgi:hypothetical protein